MSDHRTLRILRTSLALVALAVGLVLLGLAVAGPASAASAPPASMKDAVVKAGEDITIARGETAAGAVAFGGDITVNGTVQDAVVAFGGDITVNGTTRNAVVAFGGDVVLGPTAVVGANMSSSEDSIVAFGGSVTSAPGARVVGQTKTFDGPGWGAAVGWVTQRTVFRPWWGFSVIGWVMQTAIFLVLALVAAALMPTQMRAAQRQLGRQPWASLGWGALTFFIVVPAILVVLVISVIGLLLVVPYALFVTLAYFFVTTSVGAFIAQRVLSGGGRKDNLMLAVTLGVVGTTIVSRIPVAGPLVLAAMMVFGSGAAVLAVVEWRRDRRPAAITDAAGAAAYPATAPVAPADTTFATQALPPVALADAPVATQALPTVVLVEAARPALPTTALIETVSGPQVPPPAWTDQPPDPEPPEPPEHLAGEAT